MSRPALSMIAFATYLVVIGFPLVVAPDWVSSLTRMPADPSGAVRVVGMLCLFLAFYYSCSAIYENRQFMRWTVYARSLVPVFFGSFVVTDVGPPALLALAGVDLGAAMWTWWEMQRDGSW